MWARGLAPLITAALACAPVLASPASTRAAGDLARAYDITSWYVEDGLPQNTVERLAQTPDGHLWVGTSESLVRFDGRTFEEPQDVAGGSARQPVRALHAGASGRLWIGLRPAGLAAIDEGGVRALSRDPNLAIRTLVEHDNRLWLGLEGGLATREADGRLVWRHGPFESQAARRWVASPDGATLLVGSDHDLVIEKGRERRRLALPNSACQPHGLERAQDGVVWISAKCGLLRLEGTKLERVDLGSSLEGVRIRALAIDALGALWLGTAVGLYRRAADGRLERLTAADGLASDLISALAPDRGGVLWVGTGAGLSRLRPRRLNAITTRDGLPHQDVRSVAPARGGGVWIATAAGVARWDGEATVHPLSLPSHAGESFVSVLETRDGALWLGSRGRGLGRLRQGLFTPVATPDGGTVQALFEDRNGAVWVGTSTGLLRVQGDRIETYALLHGLPSEDVRALAEDRVGRLWVGTTAGLAWLSGTDRFTIAAPSPPADPFIHALLPDDDLVWIATRAGLAMARTADASGAGFQVRPLGPAHGLRAEPISQLLDDGRGHLWLGTKRGLLRVSKSALRAALRPGGPPVSTVVFGRADGMPSAECRAGSQPAAARDDRGRHLFATVAGVVVVEPTRLVFEAAPVHARIRGVEVDGVARPLGGLASIDAGHDEVVFEFGAVSPAAADKLQFRYQLDHHDRSWHSANSRRRVAYRRIPPGRYEFRVMAANEEGVWGPPAVAALEVRPPFRQTLWFYALVTTSLIVAAAAVMRLRMRQARASFRAVMAERARLAREIHDTLNQNALGVGLQIDLARRALRDQSGDGAADRHLSLARDFLARGQQETHRLTWDLRPVLLDQGNLVLAFSEMIRQLGGASDVEIHFATEGSPRPLSPSVESHVLRIGQEALSNALRHAAARSIAVKLIFARRRVHLTVDDDGRGFDPERVAIDRDGGRARQGLVGMRERAAQMGARLTIAGRQPAGGASIHLEVPV